MRSNGFGRRMFDTSGRDLVVVPRLLEEVEAILDHGTYAELKERIRVALMARIDSSVASRMPRPALQSDVAKLVNEIATGERIQLNEAEESRLEAREEVRSAAGELQRCPLADRAVVRSGGDGSCVDDNSCRDGG